MELNPLRATSTLPVVLHISRSLLSRDETAFSKLRNIGYIRNQSREAIRIVSNTFTY